MGGANLTLAVSEAEGDGIHTINTYIVCFNRFGTMTHTTPPMTDKVLNTVGERIALVSEIVRAMPERLRPRFVGIDLLYDPYLQRRQIRIRLNNPAHGEVSFIVDSEDASAPATIARICVLV